MVDLTKLEKKEETQLVAARVPIKYIKILNKKDISISSFIKQAFIETFDLKRKQK